MAFVMRTCYEALLESNSALKDANSALKDLVNSLKNERAALLEKNKALETKLAIKHLRQGRKKVVNLVSSLIFAALYSDIVVRRMGQILALARTLRSTAAIYSPDRSRLLGYERTVDRSHGDWFHPTWYWDTSDADAPGSALAERCATSLEELILADPLVGHHMNQVARLLSVATNLRKLVLGPLPKECDLSKTLSALPTASLSLATLEDLQLSNTDGAFRTHIQETWDLPALQRLTLVGCKHFPKEFLEEHGANLKYLHLLHNGPASSPTWSELEDLEDLCPTLEHLVLPYMPVYSPPSIVRSPSLRCLDMWGLTPRRRVVELMLELGLMCGMPSLQRIRILPHHDEGVLPAGLPLLCHPGDVDEDETRVRVFPGVYVLQTSWALLVHRHLSTESDGVVFEEDPWADSASDSALSWCEEDVAMGEGEEGNEEEELEDELETGSEVDSICAEAEKDYRAGEQNSDGVHEKETDDGVEADGTETAIERDEEPDEVKQTSERKDDEDEGEGYFTREELLKRFCKSQREDFIFDRE
ncbi:hypothetical protein GSI_15593 [Ganoderma sinense ZZ0214-1]|uniref:Uncharacterized protein n=1 Tax=Ganoderma sinense ZZ0214-1 TaxID=1077348 RepID=A0A2G8RN04_9APHY|nr:hypothetical protein GSI_15593 [Ganoderma sinense ZZ0214-1]